MEKGKYKITTLDNTLLGSLFVDEESGIETWKFNAAVPEGFRAVRVRELPSFDMPNTIIVPATSAKNLNEQETLNDDKPGGATVLRAGVYLLLDDSRRHLGRIFSINMIEHWFTESESPNRFLRVERARDLRVGETSELFRREIENTLGHFTYYRRVIAQ